MESSSLRNEEQGIDDEGYWIINVEARRTGFQIMTPAKLKEKDPISYNMLIISTVMCIILGIVQNIPIGQAGPAVVEAGVKKAAQANVVMKHVLNDEKAEHHANPEPKNPADEMINRDDGYHLIHGVVDGPSYVHVPTLEEMVTLQKRMLETLEANEKLLEERQKARDELLKTSKAVIVELSPWSDDGGSARSEVLIWNAERSPAAVKMLMIRTSSGDGHAPLQTGRGTLCELTTGRTCSAWCTITQDGEDVEIRWNATIPGGGDKLISVWLVPKCDPDPKPKLSPKGLIAMSSLDLKFFGWMSERHGISVIDVSKGRGTEHITRATNHLVISMAVLVLGRAMVKKMERIMNGLRRNSQRKLLLLGLWLSKAISFSGLVATVLLVYQTGTEAIMA